MKLPKFKPCVIYFALGIILGIVIGVVGSNIYPILIIPSVNQTSDEAYTHYFEILDNTTILNDGTNEINAIINESSKSANDTQRLNKIADMITDNYNDKISGSNPFLPNSSRYWYDEYGHIRVIPSPHDPDEYIAAVDQKLEFDPNWLIYQKFGACRELSVIFNYIANKAGFKSRIIRSGNGNDEFGSGANHWWNEVELNGVNKTFDVQWYLQIKTHKSQGSTWSGNRSDFLNNSDHFDPQTLCSWGGHG